MKRNILLVTNSDSHLNATVAEAAKKTGRELKSGEQQLRDIRNSQSRPWQTNNLPAEMDPYRKEGI